MLNKCLRTPDFDFRSQRQENPPTWQLSVTAGGMAVVTSASWRGWQLPGSLLLLAVLVYVNSFPGQFHGDDFSIVRDNPLVENLALRTIFLSDYWGPLQNSGLSRPITVLSLALNRMILGPQPWGFHLVNVLLHALVTLLAWKALSLWGLGQRISWIGAALFAVHPIHTEVVDIVVGRSELLAALFLLAGFCCARSNQWIGNLLAGACFVLALLSKEHAIAFVALLPICDAFRAGTPGVWKQRWPLYLGLSVLAGSWLCWHTWGVVHSVPRIVVEPLYAPLASVPLKERVLTAIGLQWLYVGKLLWPYPLQGVYSGPDFPVMVKKFWTVRGLLVTGALVIVAGMIAWGWRRGTQLALFAVLYAISFAPTANIFVPTGTAFAERLAYLPSLWFCAGLAVLLGQGSPRRFLARLTWWLTLFVIAALAIATVMRNRDFSSPLVNRQVDVLRNPDNALAWYYLANILADHSDVAGAERAFCKALALAPGFSSGWQSYAGFLLENGRARAAIAAAGPIAGKPGPKATKSMMIMAKAHLELGEHDQVLNWLGQAAAEYGETGYYWNWRGQALAGLGRDAEAVLAFRQAAPWPRDSGIPGFIGNSLLRLGRFPEAVTALRQAVAEEDSASAWNSLGVAFAMMGRHQDATSAFEHAVAKTPENRKYQENLNRSRQQP